MFKSLAACIVRNRRAEQLLAQQWLPHAKSRPCISYLSQQNSAKDADVLIIGGGAMGSSSAFFIKSSSPDLNVVVVERDPKVNYHRNYITSLRGRDPEQMVFYHR